MGTLTTPLYTILRSNTHGYDLNTMSGLHDAAMETVFNLSPLTAISNEYVDRFVTGFALHYFAREIGQETIPLWKMSLNDKIVNNAEYINSIFDSLDKQVFSNYRVHRGTKHDNSLETRLDLDDKNRNDSRSHKSEETDFRNELNTDMSNSDMKTDETELKTGVANNESNTENITDGNIVDASTEVGTSNDDTIATKQNGGYNQTDSNGISGMFDTPMGKVDNMRVPNTDLTGTGVRAVLASEYNYMSGASSNDNSVVANTNTNESSANTNEHADNKANSGNQVTHNQGNIDNTENNAHSDQSNRDMSQNNNDVSSSLTQNDDLRNIEDVDTSVGNENNQNSGSRSNIGDSEYESVDYELTNEVVLRSLPFMEKIWRVFDPCFSLII